MILSILRGIASRLGLRSEETEAPSLSFPVSEEAPTSKPKQKRPRSAKQQEQFRRVQERNREWRQSQREAGGVSIDSMFGVRGAPSQQTAATASTNPITMSNNNNPDSSALLVQLITSRDAALEQLMQAKEKQIQQLERLLERGTSKTNMIARRGGNAAAVRNALLAKSAGEEEEQAPDDDILTSNDVLDEAAPSFSVDADDDSSVPDNVGDDLTPALKRRKQMAVAEARKLIEAEKRRQNAQIRKLTEQQAAIARAEARIREKNASILQVHDQRVLGVAPIPEYIPPSVPAPVTNTVASQTAQVAASAASQPPTQTSSSSPSGLRLPSKAATIKETQTRTTAWSA